MHHHSRLTRLDRLFPRPSPLSPADLEAKRQRIIARLQAIGAERLNAMAADETMPDRAMRARRVISIILAAQARVKNGR